VYNVNDQSACRVSVIVLCMLTTAARAAGALPAVQMLTLVLLVLPKCIASPAICTLDVIIVWLVEAEVVRKLSAHNSLLQERIHCCRGHLSVLGNLQSYPLDTQLPEMEVWGQVGKVLHKQMRSQDTLFWHVQKGVIHGILIPCSQSPHRSQSCCGKS
jgi:hypothetical protein